MHPDYVRESRQDTEIKPEEDAFLGLFQVIGMKAEECIFFDDSLRNVEAAREIGMESIHYKGLGHLRSTIKKR